MPELSFFPSSPSSPPYTPPSYPKDMVGTLDYVAPEVFVLNGPNAKQQQVTHYDYKARGEGGREGESREAETGGCRGHEMGRQQQEAGEEGPGPNGGLWQRPAVQCGRRSVLCPCSARFTAPFMVT